MSTDTTNNPPPPDNTNPPAGTPVPPPAPTPSSPAGATATPAPARPSRWRQAAAAIFPGRFGGRPGMLPLSTTGAATPATTEESPEALVARVEQFALASGTPLETIV